VVAALAHLPTSPFFGGCLFFVGIAVILGYLLRDVRRYPRVPCPACGGTGRRYSSWNPRASGPRCRRCGGKGYVRRRGAPVE
jgi:hypothetical protein